MLKKVGTIVAMTTVGLLVLGPLAYADEDTHQSNSQSSNQGNGALNGNNVGSGNGVQVGNVNVNALNNLVGAVAVIGNVASSQTSTVTQGGGSFTNSGSAVGQSTTQTAKNVNKKKNKKH